VVDGDPEAIGSAPARLVVRLAFVLPVWVATLGTVLLYATAPEAYSCILRSFGVPPAPHGLPFFDARLIPDTLECWRHGVDVYRQNPCDWLGRLQDYSPVYLRLHVLPAGDGAPLGYGMAFLASFLAALAVLPLSLLRWPHWAVFALATVSPATAFAAERGNIDLLMIACCVAAARMMALSPFARAGGYALVLGAASIKFYPILALAPALRERRAMLVAVITVTGAAIGAFAWRFGSEVPLAIANTAQGNLADFWGAKSLPYGAFEIAQIQHPDFFQAHPVLATIGPAALVALFAGGALTAAFGFATDRGLAEALTSMKPSPRIMLVTGSALLCGVFATHLNSGYRLIVLLVGLPGLLSLSQAAQSKRCRAVTLGAAIASAGLCWLATTTPHDAVSFLIWIAKQAACWFVATVYAAVLMRFAADEIARVTAPAPARWPALRTSA
jgi:hypothetical protein